MKEKNVYCFNVETIGVDMFGTELSGVSDIYTMPIDRIKSEFMIDNYNPEKPAMIDINGTLGNIRTIFVYPTKEEALKILSSIDK